MTRFFSLEHSIAPRLIRILYAVVVVLIAIFVILGLVRGITVATRMPRPQAPITAQAPPDGAAMPAPPLGAPRGGMMGPRRFAGRGYGPGPGRVFGIRAAHYPALAGGFIILRSLVMGFIALFVVRILAEMALAVLNLPRRSEA